MNQRSVKRKIRFETQRLICESQVQAEALNLHLDNEISNSSIIEPNDSEKVSNLSDCMDVDNHEQLNGESEDECVLDDCLNDEEATFGSNYVNCSESEDESSCTFDEHEEAAFNEQDLAFQLSFWAHNFHISLAALSALLLILRAFHPLLPKCASTLMETPRHVNIRNVAGGSYFHFGFEKALRCCSKLEAYLRSKICSSNDVPQQTEIHVQVNIDGIPLHKSTSSQFWPILGKICSPFKSIPFLIGLFYGRCAKPSSIRAYLSDFINECLLFQNQSLKFVIDGYRVPVFVKLQSFICDAPAKSMVKCVIGHTGFSSCHKCTVHGDYINNRVTFTDLNAPLRDDHSFRQESFRLNGRDEGHHKGGISPLLHLDIDMIKQFPLDYMHLVCLGATRRLCNFWFKPGKNIYKRGQDIIDRISNSLITLRDFIPREFARKCRGICDLDKWKALEFRQFLLYSGVVALKGNLPDEWYMNFLLLSSGIHCLVDPSMYYAEADFAEMLLKLFVSSASDLYGPEFVVHNIHNLVHLPADAKLFGPLDAFSAFAFENFLRHLKALVRKPQAPLQQIARRIIELTNKGMDLYSETNQMNLKFQGLHTRGPVPRDLHIIVLEQFTSIWYKNNFFSTALGDNCVKVQNNYFLIQNILTIEGDKIVFVLKKFMKVEDFFEIDYPTLKVASSHFGIQQCSNKSADLTYAAADIVQSEMVCLPFKGTFVLFHLS